MVRCNFKIFIVSVFLLFLVSFTPSLIADQKVSNQPSIKRSNPQSTIQNLSSTSIGDPKFEKSEVIQKTAKLQMPFIANEGQTDEKVAFYANTFGGMVFVTKDGNIVYSLPHTVAHASPLVHYDIDKNETGYTGLTGYRGKEGQCIVHRTLCTMSPYCTWNFPVHYSETKSPVCHSERSEESYINNSQSEILNPKSVNFISPNPKSENTVIRDRGSLSVNNKVVDANTEPASSKRNLKSLNPKSKIRNPKSKI